MNYMAIPGLHRPTVYDRMRVTTVKDNEPPNQVNVARAIMDIIEKYLGLPEGSLKSAPGKGRSSSSISKGKHLSTYFIKRNTDLTYFQIASLLGAMHHTSVMYGEKMIISQISAPVFNSIYMTNVNDLKNLIENR